MSTAAATVEEPPLSLAAAAKAHFQPAQQPRDVTPPEPKPAAPVKEPVSKEPEPKAPAPKEPAAKAPAKAPDAKIEPEPAAESEDDAVFGTAAAKAPDPKAIEPKAGDAEFEAALAKETEGMTEKAGAKWVDLRRAKKLAEDDARQAREELKAAAEARQESKADELNPKLELLTQENADLKAQLAEAEKVLTVTQVERSQKFRREVSEPMGELTKQADEIAVKYGVEPKTVLAALNASDAKDQIADIAADFKEADRLDLYQIARDMDRLRKKGDGLREKAKTDLSALELEEREAEERETAEVRQAFSGSAQRTWAESAKALAFLRDNPLAPEWTAALATARTQSANYVPGQDPISDGRMIARATQTPFLLRALEHHKTKLAALAAERDTLLERIASDTAHDAGLAGGRDEETPTGEDEDEGLSLGEGAKKKFGPGAQ